MTSCFENDILFTGHHLPPKSGVHQHQPIHPTPGLCSASSSSPALGTKGHQTYSGPITSSPEFSVSVSDFAYQEQSSPSLDTYPWDDDADDEAAIDSSLVTFSKGMEHARPCPAVNPSSLNTTATNPSNTTSSPAASKDISSGTLLSMLKNIPETEQQRSTGGGSSESLSSRIASLQQQLERQVEKNSNNSNSAAATTPTPALFSFEQMHSKQILQGVLGSPIRPVPSPQKGTAPPSSIPTFLTPAVKSTSIEFPHPQQPQLGSFSGFGQTLYDINLPRAFSLEFGLLNSDHTSSTPLSIFGNPLEKDPFSREFFPSSHFTDVFGPTHLSPFPATTPTTATNNSSPSSSSSSTSFNTRILPPGLTSTSFYPPHNGSSSPVVSEFREKRKAPPSSLAIESTHSPEPVVNVPILQNPSPRPKKAKTPNLAASTNATAGNEAEGTTNTTQAPPASTTSVASTTLTLASSSATSNSSTMPATTATPNAPSTTFVIATTTATSSTTSSSQSPSPKPTHAEGPNSRSPKANPAAAVGSAMTGSHGEFGLLGARECAHCKTTNTPLWRQGLQGETLCNACGLYLKQHNKPRPLKLTQNPSLPKKKWRIPKGADLFCSNCETRATPIWRRSPEGNLLCNACGLHLRIHQTQRPKVMKTEEFKKRGPPQHKRKRTLHSDDASHVPGGGDKSSSTEENDYESEEGFEDGDGDETTLFHKSRSTSSTSTQAQAQAQGGPSVEELKAMLLQQQEKLIRYQNSVIDRAGYLASAPRISVFEENRYREEAMESPVANTSLPPEGFSFPQQHNQQQQQIGFQHHQMGTSMTTGTNEGDMRHQFTVTSFQPALLLGGPQAVTNPAFQPYQFNAPFNQIPTGTRLQQPSGMIATSFPGTSPNQHFLGNGH